METIFIAAVQSSFLLGIVHGINPCGHSWLVLAPFIAGEKQGRKVTILTLSFLSGTTIACLLLGATLGTVSSFIPATANFWFEICTSTILILLGILLVYNPEILHSHEHHDHDHHDHHEQKHTCNHHDHCHNTKQIFSPKEITAHKKTLTEKKHKWLACSLFGVGFVNMIIPCPTAAVMYGYALHSGDALYATLVFGVYAFSTALSVGTVIFIIFHATSMAKKLQKDWLEPLIMRLAGCIIILFSGYTLYADLMF